MSVQATVPATHQQSGTSRRWRFGTTERSREQIAAYLFIAPWLIGFLIFSAGAMAYSLNLSFYRTDLLSMSKFVGLDNYRDLLDDQIFHKSLRITTIYALLTVIPGTILALSIAMMLNQKIRFMSIWRTVYYLPSVVSGIAVAIIWSWVLQADYGLVNSFLARFGIVGPRWFASEEWAIVGLALMALWGTGSNMLLFLAGLQSIPTELLEAADLDGANGWSKFRHITVPLLTPTIFFSVVIGVIGSYQVFTSAYVVTEGGPNNATMTLVLFLYRQAFQLFEFGYASAVAWVLFLIILVFTLILISTSKHWVHYEGGERR